MGTKRPARRKHALTAKQLRLLFARGILVSHKERARRVVEYKRGRAGRLKKFVTGKRRRGAAAQGLLHRTKLAPDVTDLSPKRGQRQLHHSDIPHPGILRATTPELVLGNFRQALKGEIRFGRTPSGAELFNRKGEFAARPDEAEHAEYEKTGLHLGLANSSTRAFTSHALGGRMLFGPDWYADAGSPDLIARAQAFHTYAHEEFHAHRKAPLTRIVSLEEGLAEMYAEQATRRHLGYTPSGTRIYAAAKERAQALALHFGDGSLPKGMQILLRSRSADDLPQWLYEAGIKHGIPKSDLNALIFKPEELQRFLARGGKLE